MSPEASAAWIAFAASAAATALLARFAPALGWIDRRDGELAQRKPRTGPVALVGGAALLAGLAAAELASPGLSGVPRVPWPAVLAALVLGLVDDLRTGGLAPVTKLAGQLVVGLLLAAEPSIEPRERWLWALGAVIAQNAWNTWDHADGNASSLGLLALLSWPAARGALAGFLPFNLLPAGRVRAAGERAPLAYLGDSGSHVLGVLVVWWPAARPALLLPLLDLVRLAWLRAGEGRAPWRGDRRHLGHRLAARGLGPAAAAGCLTLAASPPFLARALAARGLVPGWVEGAGWSLAALAFVALLACTEDPGAGAGADRGSPDATGAEACPPRGRAR